MGTVKGRKGVCGKGEGKKRGIWKREKKWLMIIDERMKRVKRGYDY